VGGSNRAGTERRECKVVAVLIVIGVGIGIVATYGYSLIKQARREFGETYEKCPLCGGEGWVRKENDG